MVVLSLAFVSVLSVGMALYFFMTITEQGYNVRTVGAFLSILVAGLTSTGTLIVAMIS